MLEGLRLTSGRCPGPIGLSSASKLAAALAALGVGQRAQPILPWAVVEPRLRRVLADRIALPYTAFLHAAAAPFNLMAHPGRPEAGAGRTLRSSGDRGQRQFRRQGGCVNACRPERSARFALQACTNCGRCDSVCPAFASGTRLVAPTARPDACAAAARRANTDRISSIRATCPPPALWACTTCAACVEACPVFIRPVDYIVPFRRELVTRQQIGQASDRVAGQPRPQPKSLRLAGGTAPTPQTRAAHARRWNRI